MKIDLPYIQTEEWGSLSVWINQIWDNFTNVFHNQERSYQPCYLGTKSSNQITIHHVKKQVSITIYLQIPTIDEE